MKADSAPAESALVLSSPAASAAGEVALPRNPATWFRLTLPRYRVGLGPLAGRLAMISVILGAGAIVAFAVSGPSTLVPRSNEVFPGWEAGPLHALFHGLPSAPKTLGWGLSGVLVVMLLAYFVILAAARSLSLRTIVVGILALHLILLMSPPLQLTDMFNYLGYARLGALHGLNPYTHVIKDELNDPVYLMSTWHNLSSPYGQLFTAATYLLPLGSLAVSYWLVKTITVLASLAFLALVWQCARMLGRDPRVAVVFVAFNPIYLVYAIGGFHNDFFMLIPSLGAVALLLARRDRTAGAVLMLAVFVKFTAILLLPFLLVAVLPDRRRALQILLGAVAAAIPLALLSVALFGFSLPNLQDQSTLLTWFSIPNVVGLLLGSGGSPALLRLFDVAVVVAVIVLLRRRGDWIARAGWATLALIASLAWLMPWYVIWLAPLAALSSSYRLRQVTLALTVFLVLTFLPATQIIIQAQGFNPLGTPAGHASSLLQKQLS
ncbi:MAG TPA: glycosyltransferase family 87 protein [Solirubrobacteraceae bacterium]|nr:glycosyltransferase family 87 protein [Solirubrobacteraceae bacterium]